MTTLTARQPKGIHIGGQFAATTHAEPGTSLSMPVSLHERTHAGLVNDQMNTHEEARSVRDAIYASLVAGDFGTKTTTVRNLADDDRLIRLAIDRYVVTEDNEPGSFRPKDAGHNLGCLLVELQAEDLADEVDEYEDDEDL
ncbi:hypothetical protein IV500_05310 [Paeniglutamicibacter antarcticus]|uniref:Uncharacterized protein n=1 Tax=Arthrobacter terrae TaxID=2935737 RepID=A0A931G4I6_9MICC|nr:hypothetical protein [Arthrobacter terrae]MBG0738838.1 hypothetical protein [Arthrobacter terrae]